MKNVVLLGGVNWMSTLLKGLKLFPIKITSVVTVSDTGKSTGRLREEFNMPAVGDIRRVIVSVSENEKYVDKLFNYRFNTNSDLDGHTIGNLLLTAATEVNGSLSKGVEYLSDVLSLKGTVLPLTEDNVELMCETTNGKIIEGEENITKSNSKIKRVFYKENPKINEKVINDIKHADLIILSMGSIYTSVIPNLLCDEVKKAIDESKAKVLYILNLMTQPGESENFNASKHIEILNEYLGNKKISLVLANNGKISKKIRKNYLVKEQKDPVFLDNKFLKNENIKIKLNDYVKLENDTLIHNVEALALDIYSYLLFNRFN